MRMKSKSARSAGTRNNPNDRMAKSELLEQVLGMGLASVMAVFTTYTGAFWLDDGSSNRKRVFSPGFDVFCTNVAVVELITMNHS